jgi:hypothetical protein
MHAEAEKGIASFFDPSLSLQDQFATSPTQRRLVNVLQRLPEQNRWYLYLRAKGLVIVKSPRSRNWSDAWRDTVRALVPFRVLLDLPGANAGNRGHDL